MVLTLAVEAPRLVNYEYECETNHISGSHCDVLSPVHTVAEK